MIAPDFDRSELTFPHPVPPAPGETVEIAPGILWCRLALPFRLDHVNVYLLEDGPGFTLVDTGIGDGPTQAAWSRLFEGALRGRPLTRIIATHFHPDHIGCAGWLADRFGVELIMSETEYLRSLNLHLDPGALEAEHYRRFYLDHGLDADTTGKVVTQGHGYLRMMSGLPPTFRRIVAGDTIRIGGRAFEVSCGGGHSPEQVMLLCRSDGIFLAADQVLAKISPNVSVWAVDPEGDPLGRYLRSLETLAETVAGDVLVLPGHNIPFFGLHQRIAELAGHHEARCRDIAAACSGRPRSAAEIVPVVFKRPLDPHQMGFAFSEILAHVNYMLRREELLPVDDGSGVRKVVASPGRGA